MSESQSRYSIVERLTRTKLDIMSAKSDLSQELKVKEQKVSDLEKDYKNWLEDIEEDIKRQKRIKEREIEDAKRDYQNALDRQKVKEKVYDEKIDAINIALQSVEEISKTTPTINK